MPNQAKFLMFIYEPRILSHLAVCITEVGIMAALVKSRCRNDSGYRAAAQVNRPGFEDAYFSERIKP